MIRNVLTYCGKCPNFNARDEDSRPLQRLASRDLSSTVYKSIRSQRRYTEGEDERKELHVDFGHRARAKDSLIVL